ncbi:morn repeat incomplete domain containing protein [Pandoravirus celtis]|uniref:Morn repeat incomplete domain containing protein n=1 Tax=Pandoravirus celtis TaxID=2568002 RepID=A0A4D6EIL8_9VIRU|nr:morn repeat incomplete domain containing protein [Pandoravirus celtis]
MDAKFNDVMGCQGGHLVDNNLGSGRWTACHATIVAAIIVCSAVLSYVLSLGPAVGALLAATVVVRFYATKSPRDRPAIPLGKDLGTTRPRPTSPSRSVADSEEQKETRAKTGDLRGHHERWASYRAGITDAYGGQAEFDALCDTLITPHSFASDEWLRVGRYDSDDGTLLRGQLASIGDKCVLHGYGIRTTPDGTVHEGKWYMGQPDGMGRRTVPDGRVIEGHWAWDVPDAICTRTHL